MQAKNIGFRDKLYSFNYQNKAEPNARIKVVLPENIETYPNEKKGVSLQKKYYVMIQTQEQKISRLEFVPN